ncbi:hypothetical protein ACV1CY_16185, partial [Aeromonas caviae]
MARILMTRALDDNGHIVDVKDVVSGKHAIAHASVVRARSGPAFFKIVVAQSCFKQPLFAPARVSRA